MLWKILRDSSNTPKEDALISKNIVTLPHYLELLRNTKVLKVWIQRKSFLSSHLVISFAGLLTHFTQQHSLELTHIVVF